MKSSYREEGQTQGTHLAPNSQSPGHWPGFFWRGQKQCFEKNLNVLVLTNPGSSTNDAKIKSICIMLQLLWLTRNVFSLELSAKEYPSYCCSYSERACFYLCMMTLTTRHVIAICHTQNDKTSPVPGENSLSTAVKMGTLKNISIHRKTRKILNVHALTWQNLCISAECFGIHIIYI